MPHLGTERRNGLSRYRGDPAPGPSSLPHSIWYPAPSSERHVMQNRFLDSIPWALTTTTTALLLSLGGCGDGGTRPNPGSETGSLAVTAATTGTDLDADGYGIVVAGVPKGNVGANGTRTVTGLSAGSHTRDPERSGGELRRRRRVEVGRRHDRCVGRGELRHRLRSECGNLRSHHGDRWSRARPRWIHRRNRRRHADRAGSQGIRAGTGDLAFHAAPRRTHPVSPRYLLAGRAIARESA